MDPWNREIGVGMEERPLLKIKREIKKNERKVDFVRSLTHVENSEEFRVAITQVRDKTFRKLGWNELG